MCEAHSSQWDFAVSMFVLFHSLPTEQGLCVASAEMKSSITLATQWISLLVIMVSFHYVLVK